MSGAVTTGSPQISIFITYIFCNHEKKKARKNKKRKRKQEKSRVKLRKKTADRKKGTSADIKHGFLRFAFLLVLKTQ